MCQRNVAYKGFLISMVLFCAYMQWSPTVDLDYLWINGQEHYIGAASPHPVGKMVIPALPRPIGEVLQDSAPQLGLLPVAQSATRLAPPTTLRL